LAERIAQLYVELSARTDKLEAELKKSQAGLGKFKGGLNDVVQGLTGMNLATIGTAAVVGGLAAGLKFAVSQAMEAEAAMAQTESAIKATGGAAGLTAVQVANMAGELSEMTGLADDVIQSGQNMLLTFKNIKGDTFERTTKAMTDMAVAMNGGNLEGIDLKNTAIQLGKALNDPLQGLTALSRVGVTFTEGQKNAIKAMVEMGDVAGAQALILAELESEFGGAAEAAGNTAAGQFAKLKNEAGELGEEIGTVLIPSLTDAAVAGTDFIRYWRELGGAVAEGEMSLLEFQKTGYSVIFTNETMAGAVDEVRQGVADEQAAIEAVDPWLQNMRASTEAVTVATAESGVVASSTGGYYQNLARDVGVLMTAQEKLTFGLKNYTVELLFNQAAAGLDAEAALRLGVAMGVVDERSLIAATSVEELKNKYDTNRDGALSAAEASHGYLGEVLQLQNAINSLESREVTVTTNFVTNHVTTGEPSSGQFFNQGGQAAGGPTSLFGSGPRWVGEQGPEIWVPPVPGGYILNNQDAMAAVNSGSPMGGGDNGELVAMLRELPAAIGRSVRDNMQRAMV
jgi:hypothetical protein